MLISVIIPSFNRASMLCEALESVLTQDYFSQKNHQSFYEIIVVDDGSTDDTRHALKQFNHSISCISTENKGVSAARNLGVRSSTGDFIAFLDSDDLWEKEKLSIQMNFMKTFPNAVMNYTNEKWIKDGVFVNQKNKHKKYSGMIFDKVLPLCLLSLSSALFRRKIFSQIGDFDENLPVCEDYDFSIRLAFHYPWYLIDKPLIIKRGGHEDQLSQRFHSMDVHRIFALEKALNLNLDGWQRSLVKKEIIKKSEILILGYKKRDQLGKIRFYEKMLQKYRL